MPGSARPRKRRRAWFDLAPLAEIYKETLRFVGELATDIRKNHPRFAVFIIVAVLLCFLACGEMIVQRGKESAFDHVIHFALLISGLFVFIVTVDIIRPAPDRTLAEKQEERKKRINPPRIQ